MTTALEHDTLNRETIEWAYNTFLSLGFTLKSSVPEKVQDTPWSCVIRFITEQGIIYLKQTPK